MMYLLMVLVATITFMLGIVTGWLSLLVVQAQSEHKTHLILTEAFKNEHK